MQTGAKCEKVLPLVESLYQSLWTTTHNKVICIGRNYSDHAKEMNAPVPKKPMIFDKALSRVVKSGDVLYLRSDNEVHHEVELGVMIGKTARNVKADDWKKYVEGYFLGIDFTDRDLQA